MQMNFTTSTGSSPNKTNKRSTQWVVRPSSFILCPSSFILCPSFYLPSTTKRVFFALSNNDGVTWCPKDFQPQLKFLPFKVSVWSTFYVQFLYIVFFLLLDLFSSYFLHQLHNFIEVYSLVNSTKDIEYKCFMSVSNYFTWRNFLSISYRY